MNLDKSVTGKWRIDPGKLREYAQGGYVIIKDPAKIEEEN